MMIQSLRAQRRMEKSTQPFKKLKTFNKESNLDK